MKTTRDYMLAFGMLITGSINTISTKIADDTSAQGICDGSAFSDTLKPGVNRTCHERPFNHPFLQAVGMFIGEALVLVAFYISEMLARRNATPDGYLAMPSEGGTNAGISNPSSVVAADAPAGEGGEDGEGAAKEWSPVIFALPACCDMSGTSTMYLGLTMTYASVFQMLRGTVVIFTGIMSVLFLGRKLYRFHWFSMFCVLAGAAVVGYASISGGESAGASNPMLGNILIVAAQLIVSVQMVVEEKFLGGYDIHAMQAVGWEGVWGFSILSLVCIGLFYIPDETHATGRFEDSLDGFVQISNNGIIVAAILGNIFSIAFFNYFGISVTKSMSAAHRMVLDSVRTVVIWGYGLASGAERFHGLQLLGFAILLFGTVLYNEVVRFPQIFEYPPDDDTNDWKTPAIRPANSEEKESPLFTIARQGGQSVENLDALEKNHPLDAHGSKASLNSQGMPRNASGSLRPLTKKPSVDDWSKGKFAHYTTERP